MNEWRPQISYPCGNCGNFSDTSYLKLREISILTGLALGHLRYLLTDVPPQSQ